MDSPLLNDVYRETLPETSNALHVDSSVTKPVPPPSIWKPVVTRVVLSGLALVGLAGVGAASMLAGLDGARANSPQVTATHAPSGAASPDPFAKATPSATAPEGGALSPPAVSASSQVSFTAPAACSTGRTADGRVILNLATVADLRTLPGIGQKRADAILALRDKLKRFRKIQELRRVRGIGAKSLQKLTPKLLVDPPPGECGNVSK
jgi:competence protein ComEA